MYRILTAFILFLIAGSAMADSSGSLHHIRHFADRLAPPESDYSVAYLSQIFGTVGNVLSGTSGQILGKMFDIFNKGVMVVAAIWLGVTTVTLTLHASHHGNLSQKYNPVMILLRIALGFSLLIPSTMTGYSLLQDVFMKVVVQGVGLADQTWDAALNFLKYGGQLYIPPSVVASDPNVVSSMVGSSTQSPGPIAQIFADEVCMIESSKSSWSGASNSSSENFHPIYTNAATGLIYFPGNLNGVKNNPTDGKNKYSVNPTTGTPTSSNAACGFVADYYYLQSHPPAGAYNPTAAYSPGKVAALQGYSYSALKQMTHTLYLAAKEYVRHPTKAADPAKLTGQNNIKTVFSGMLAYVNLITPYQTTLTESSATDSNATHLKFIDMAKAEGWIMAGGFYWQIERANNQAASMSISKLLPNVVVPTFSNSSQKEIVTTASSMIVNPYTMDPTNGLNTLWQLYVGAQQNSISQASSVNASSSSGFVGEVSSNMLSHLTSVIYDLNSVSSYNPIAVVMKLGNQLITIIGDVWMYAIPVSFGLGFAMGLCTSVQGGGVAFQALMTWVKSIIMLLTGLLMIPGAILSYYIPLYPFAIFTFAAIGWLIMVIEGMAAIPLICVGVTHPEGNDFLGKAEQAMMLFLGIFLRPALMVMGLIAAMVVSFVGFHLLISAFQRVLAALTMSDKFGLSFSFSDPGSIFFTIISICMVLVIFGMMVMELIEQCFKLVVTLPQYILRWLGAPDSGGGEAIQMAQGIKGAAAQGAGSLEKATNASVEQAGSIGQGTGQVTGAAVNYAKGGGGTDIAANP